MEKRKHCITEILKARGIRQDWLAAQVEVSQSYLSRLLAGERAWTEDLKDKMAHALMLPRSVLFFERDCSAKLQETITATIAEPHGIPQPVSEEAT